MMPTINTTRLDVVKPSATLEMSRQAKALIRSGVDVCNLSAGEPDFNTPECIIDEAQRAMRDGVTKYTPSRGLPKLVEAIQEKFRRDQNTTYEADEVISTVGTKGALSLLFDAMINPGDEVVIFSPCWVTYPDLVRLAGGTPVMVPCTYENGWAPDVAGLKKALSPKTKAVLLCTPSNPTGMGIGREKMDEILDVIARSSAWIISDEIYERLVYEDYTHLSPIEARPDLKDRLVIVNGVAKAYAMTGWRLGYAAGPAALISGMLKLQQQRYSCATSISQAAAAFALREPGVLRQDLKNMAQEYARRRDHVASRISGIDGLRAHRPDGAFYYFIDAAALFPLVHPEAGRLETDLDFSEALLKKAHVATVPGAPFGQPGSFRTSFVRSVENLDEAFDRIARFIAECSAQ